MQLQPQHFACLRAVAEGVPVISAAERYLSVEGREARGTYRRILDQARALARRRGHADWRLLGIEIADAAAPPERPGLDEWAAEQGLEDWSHEDLVELYVDRFGRDDRQGARRRQRNERLRLRRLRLLRQLEANARLPPSPSDRIDGWLPPAWAVAMSRAGWSTLAQLHEQIALGGQWWRGLDGIGRAKAERIAQLVQALLGPVVPAVDWRLANSSSAPARSPFATDGADREAPTARLPDPPTDPDEVVFRRWADASTRSTRTAAQYRREALRFSLWCQSERRIAWHRAGEAECVAYLAFLADVPAAWQGRRQAAPLHPGWMPFRGPLSPSSQQLAAKVLASLFQWAMREGALGKNPWHGERVRRRRPTPAGGDQPPEAAVATPHRVWDHLAAAARSTADTPAQQRMAWLCEFLRCTGISVSELIAARRGDLTELPVGWLLQVRGRAGRGRLVPVPGRAITATGQYFACRGLDFEAASPQTPLLASLSDPQRSVSYQALSQAFRSWVDSVLATADGGAAAALPRPTLRWLRQQHIEQALSGGMPVHELQENLGRADSRGLRTMRASAVEQRLRVSAQVFRDKAAA